MSYQVLARKWRPRNFSTLVGQEHVVRALTHALSTGRLHHAYLLTGTRGVGKTTLARILAKSLNCETGVSATPCGLCSACIEIDSGRFVDLLEVDAATNTRVDEMRQLLENAVYAPTRGRFKVYVIDEVHMLSNSAFNAMLKTLEEPPAHVKFILATTDPQKIPVTVLSRCLQFNLKQMPPSAILGHLSHILHTESIAFETAALELLARSAAGSMRDALSLLDQAIAHGAGRVEENQVRAMLGAVDQGYLYAIFDALLASDVGAILQVATDIAGQSLSFASALQDLATLCTRLQIAQCAPLIAQDEPDGGRLLSLANAFPAEFIQLAYQIVNLGRQELMMAPDDYSGFVMTLLRLYTFKPDTISDIVVSARSQRLGEQGAPRAHQATTANLANGKLRTDEALEKVGGAEHSLPADGVSWAQVVSVLQLSGLAKELALNCEFRSFDSGRCLLRLSPVHVHLQMKPSPERLQQALSDHLGIPVQVHIEVARNQVSTPAESAGRLKKELQQKARDVISQDDFVRDVIDVCQASVVEGSIRPIKINQGV